MTGRNPDGSPAVGMRMNNPCNVRCLAKDSPFPHSCEKAGKNGYFSHFTTPEVGIAACVELYGRKYRGLEVDGLVKLWAQTTRERNPGYFEAVEICF